MGIEPASPGRGRDWWLASSGSGSGSDPGSSIELGLELRLGLGFGLGTRCRRDWWLGSDSGIEVGIGLGSTNLS